MIYYTIIHRLRSMVDRNRIIYDSSKPYKYVQHWAMHAFLLVKVGVQNFYKRLMEVFHNQPLSTFKRSAMNDIGIPYFKTYIMVSLVLCLSCFVLNVTHYRLSQDTNKLSTSIIFKIVEVLWYIGAFTRLSC